MIVIQTCDDPSARSVTRVLHLAIYGGFHPQHTRSSLEQDSVETLFNATNLLVLGGVSSVVTSIMWWALTPDPDDPVELSLEPQLSPAEFGTRVQLRF